MWIEGEVDRIRNKEYPWKEIKNFNPDCQPSHSAIFIEEMGTDILGVFQVKGLGVITLRATPDLWNKGKLKFDGMGIITKGEIGYAPNL